MTVLRSVVACFQGLAFVSIAKTSDTKMVGHKASGRKGATSLSGHHLSRPSGDCCNPVATEKARAIRSAAQAGFGPPSGLALLPSGTGFKRSSSSFRGELTRVETGHMVI